MNSNFEEKGLNNMIPNKDLKQIATIYYKDEYIEKAHFAHCLDWDVIFKTIHLDSLIETDIEDCKLMAYTNEQGIKHKVIMYDQEWPVGFITIVYTYITDDEFYNIYKNELSQDILKLL